MVNNTEIQQLFDDAVNRGLAPGFQYAIFNQTQLLVNGTSGLAKIASETDPHGVPMQPETILWVASAGKILVSLATLIVLERGLAHNGMTLDDLDNHEKLVEILPEFRHGSGSLVTKTVTGFEEQLDPNGKKVPILHDTKGKITLRDLMTHTSGFPYFWNDELMLEFYVPSDGSIPIRGNPLFTGLVADLEVPAVCEPGTTVTYGGAADWLGQFVVRASGKGLPALWREFIFEPLEMPPEECGSAKTPTILKSLAPIYSPLPEGGFAEVPIPVYTCEDDSAPPGYAHHASGTLFTSIRTYSKLLQAVMRRDTKLLSKRTWELALADQLKDRGIKVPRPRWKTSSTSISNDLDEYSAAADPSSGSSVNLLQCEIATGPRRSGRPDGSYGWTGAWHTFFTIDEANDIGYAWSAQSIPFVQPALFDLRDEFEKRIWNASPNA